MPSAAMISLPISAYNSIVYPDETIRDYCCRGRWLFAVFELAFTI